MKSTLAILTLTALLLTGCTSGSKPADTGTDPVRTSVSAEPTDTRDPGTSTAVPTPSTSGTASTADTAGSTVDTAVPGPTKPVTGYRCDPHLFYANLSDPAYYPDACRLVDAIAGYADFLPVDDPEIASAIADNIFYNYPPAALCSFTAESGGIRIRYAYKEGEHRQRIADFYAKVEEILNTVLTPGMTELQTALELYRYTATHVRYFSVDYTPADTSAYCAITRGVTICYGFADCFNSLLRQAGIQAELLRGYRAGDRADHGWSLVLLDGVRYHCDPTWECSGTDGIGLAYFGMTDRARFSSLANDAVCGFGSLQERYPGNLASDGRLYNVICADGGRFYYGPWDYESLLDALDRK